MLSYNAALFGSIKRNTFFYHRCSANLQFVIAETTDNRQKSGRIMEIDRWCEISDIKGEER